MSALVAPSGECLEVEGLVFFIGVVVCLMAAYRGFNCSLARVMDSHISTSAPSAVNCHFVDCKVRLVRFSFKMRYIRIPGFSFSFCT